MYIGPQHPHSFKQLYNEFIGVIDQSDTESEDHHSRHNHDEESNIAILGIFISDIGSDY